MPNPVSNRNPGSGGSHSSSAYNGWDSEQLANARTIASVGRSMGMSSRDIQIALMAAMQESSLRNLDYGDRDSLGLFQQRAGWGSRSNRLNPKWAATQFFQHLARIKNRNSLELWQAAQAVQISAFPHAYAAHEDSARALMAKLGAVGMVSPEEDTYKLNQYGGYEAVKQNGMGLAPKFNLLKSPSLTVAPNPVVHEDPLQNPLVSSMDKILGQDGLYPDAKQQDPAASPEPLGAGAADKAIDWGAYQPTDALLPAGVGVPGGPLDNIGQAPVKGIRSAVLNFAKKFIGTPYVFGAEGPDGFDCSSLIQYTMAHMGVHLPRLAYQQANSGEQTSIKNLQPGDLVFWGDASHTQGNHIAFYLGNNQILEAPRTGLSVRIRNLGSWSKDASAIGIKLDY